MREAFRSRGHDAFSCDLLPSLDESPHHYIGNIIKVLYDEDWDLVIAHPPCTALCVTGNRHYSGTPERDGAIQLVRAILESPYDKICVENPVGVLSSRLRKPDQYVQPYEFGHPVSKKTGLWLKGLPKLTPTNLVDKDDYVTFPSGKKMGRWFYETSCLPQKDRATARSVTFKGIADAMADQWG